MADQKTNPSLSEAAKLLGRKGGQTVNLKYGPSYFSRIGKLGMASRWSKTKGTEGTKK